MVDFSDIQKPTLLLHPGRVRENIRMMASRARAQGKRFRPHFKTHQSAEIGEWFREEGITSITVSSVDMAIYFADHGWEDITLAFPVNLRQVDELQELAARIKLGLLVESAEVVRSLGARLTHGVNIWLKVDTGLHRAGLPWDQTSAFLPIFAGLEHHPFLNVAGLLTHAGHSYHADSPDEIIHIYNESVKRMNILRQSLASSGWRGLEISIGDTPGCSLVADFGEVDEIRPGNFVFYDAQQLSAGVCRVEQVAAAMACPVVAVHPERSEIVVYGGAIHLSKDWIEVNGERRFGLVALCHSTDGWNAPISGAYVSALSQEHGIVHMPEQYLAEIQPGDLLCIIPPHICLAAQAMGFYRTIHGRRIEMMKS